MERSEMRTLVNFNRVQIGLFVPLWPKIFSILMVTRHVIIRKDIFFIIVPIQ